MKYLGQIHKMRTTLDAIVQYELPLNNQFINLNQYIGSNIEIIFNNEIHCIKCNAPIKKTFMQGYCYPCFISSPQTSDCILKPHLCQAHKGISRDMYWSKEHCLTDNYVYLSLTSNLKVGVTRASQIPTRWIDQGAHQAIQFAKTPNRHLAGMIELQLSKHISDRTQWTRMLKGEYDKSINLILQKKRLSNLIETEYKKYIINNTDITNINYPGDVKLEKIISINLEKQPNISGELVGIKGQYLIIDNKFVINIRKYTGYTISLNC